MEIDSLLTVAGCKDLLSTCIHTVPYSNKIVKNDVIFIQTIHSYMINLQRRIMFRTVNGIHSNNCFMLNSHRRRWLRTVKQNEYI